MVLLLKYKFPISLILLLIFYGVGVWGIAFGQNPSHFILLTPLNLLITLAIILANHTKWELKHLLALVAVALFGFIIEMIGVNTGLLFGDYSYGKTLGWGVFNTPFMIGVNWLILVYCASNLVLKIFSAQNIFLLSAIAASMMVVLDLLIEPVAIKLDMWSWADVNIPIQNYIGWWISAFVLNCIMIFNLKNIKINTVAVAVLGIQFLFFSLLNFLIL